MVVSPLLPTTPNKNSECFQLRNSTTKIAACGEPLDAGLMIFGEGVPVLAIPIVGEIGVKKFEQLIAYGIGFIPQGNLFTVYGDEGLAIYLLRGQYGYIQSGDSA